MLKKTKAVKVERSEEVWGRTPQGGRQGSCLGWMGGQQSVHGWKTWSLLETLSGWDGFDTCGRDQAEKAQDVIAGKRWKKRITYWTGKDEKGQSSAYSL